MRRQRPRLDSGRRHLLVSCFRSVEAKASHADEDLVVALDPHEGLWILVVDGEVEPDRVLQRSRAPVSVAN